MLCCHCGKQIDDGSSFCVYCGNEITPEMGDVTLSDATDSAPEETMTEQIVEQVDIYPEDMPLPLSEQYDEEASAAEDISSDTHISEIQDEIDEELPKKKSKKQKQAKQKKEAKETKAAKAGKKRKKVSAPKQKGKAGKVILSVLLVAVLCVGGYFAYNTWFSPEARFASAIKNGSAAYESGDYVAAAEYYTKAVEINSKSAQAYLGRGDAHIAMGEVSSAIDDYIKAYFIDTKNVELCLKIGDAYYSQQIYDNALEYYNSALKLEPSMADVYIKLADAHLGGGARDAAINILADGIAVTSDARLAEKYNGLVNSKYDDLLAQAGAYRENGDPKGALTAYAAAIAADDSRAEAYLGRAEINAGLKDNASAAADYEAAISRGAVDEDIYLAYADVCLALVESGDETVEHVVSILEAGWNATSGEKLLEKLTDVELSKPAGEYSEVFELEVTSLCSVYYTTDGSEPTTESSMYMAPISIAEGDTVVKLLPVSKGGLQGQVLTYKYNVTTIEMKAMAGFEKYFSSMFNDQEQDVLVYDVTGDGLFDMIVLDINPDDDDLYRMRVYVYDGSTVNPIYMDSKVTADNLFLCRYDGQYCFMSYTVEEETVDKVKKKTETYSIFTIQHDGSVEELKKYTVKYENGKETESDLDASTYELRDIVGVPSMAIDAFGGYEHPENELATGNADVAFYNGRYYSNNAALIEALPNCKTLDIESDLYVVGDDNVYYYAADDSSEHSVYKMPLGGGEAERINEGDGETLVYSGGWLYLGDSKRYNTLTGETVTDTFTTIDELVYTDGSYIFYNEKLSDGLSRADRDLSNSVVVLEDYERDYFYFTWDGKLFIYDTDKTPQLAAYTVNGSFLYNVELDIGDISDNYLVADGILYAVTDEMIVALNLESGKKLKEYDLGDSFDVDDILVCAGAGRLVIIDTSEPDTYIVINTAEGSYETIAPVAQDTEETE